MVLVNSFKGVGCPLEKLSNILDITKIANKIVSEIDSFSQKGRKTTLADAIRLQVKYIPPAIENGSNINIPASIILSPSTI
jgi:hypothetical protein